MANALTQTVASAIDGRMPVPEPPSPRERLEAYLTWKGWSQSDFARAAKLHSTTVSKLLASDEEKRREPGLAVAVAIERVTADAPDGPILAMSWLGHEGRSLADSDEPDTGVDPKPVRAA